MKTIIAATDFSEASDNAVAFAAALAKYFHAKLILFNAFHLPNPNTRAPFSTPDFKDLHKENKERLQGMASDIAQMFNIETESVSRLSFMTDELTKLVSQTRADLVVMGMRGSSLTQKLFGSTTTSMLRQANFPLLVIPENAVFHKIQKMLFACDSRKLTLATNLNPLKKLAHAFNSRLQILQVVNEEEEDDDEIMEETVTLSSPRIIPSLENIFKGLKHSYRMIEDDDIVDGIEKGIQDYGADLLVMAPHRGGFWDSVLRTGNTRKMALRTKIPLLAIPIGY